MTDKKKASTKIGVVLMTYGSPATIDAVPQFFSKVYGGKKADISLIDEFKRRYNLIGGSPLIRITKEQAIALEKELTMQNQDGPMFHVISGMRFSEPFISDVVATLDKDTKRLIGIIMSPQYSPIIMSGYHKILEEAVQQIKRPDLKLDIATDWHLQPLFLQALAQRVEQALNKFSPDIRKHVPVLFSAHSMPKRVIDKEPDYISQLKETAQAVANIIGLPKKRWLFCYQSAGHTPEEWLKPDFADIMPELQKQGQTHVLIAPVQFLADHLEILYDVGIGAREQAEKQGIIFARTESLNTSPLFIKALAKIVQERLNFIP